MHVDQYALYCYLKFTIEAYSNWILEIEANIQQLEEENRILREENQALKKKLKKI